MEGGGDNCPLESMFGDEDILPLSDIAADITQLVTYLHLQTSILKDNYLRHPPCSLNRHSF